eukprot:TRINITY_DN2315_c5_g1_i1.p1 TRINITY_DN2315_c5_g1~~TRINITY_DN2315_c5_g1_i1.p1  ORF type:complete len:787 (+),score=218.95 TRINITY_DN2315_c5_g1_i1:69-2363(+)
MAAAAPPSPGYAASALLEAASRGDSRAVAEWAEGPHGTRLADATGPAPLARSALHVAAEAGHAAVVALLLRLGAQVDVEDAQRSTPLHLAASAGHADVVAALLAHSGNAALSKKDGSGRSVLDCAASTQVLQVVSRQLLESREGRSRALSKVRGPPQTPSSDAGSSGPLQLGPVRGSVPRMREDSRNRLDAVEAALDRQIQQNHYLRSCLTSMADKLALPLPPAPADPTPAEDLDLDGRERLRRLERTVVEADEARVRAHLITRQEVAYLEIVWQHRKAVARTSQTQASACFLTGASDNDTVRISASLSQSGKLPLLPLNRSGVPAADSMPFPSATPPAGSARYASGKESGPPTPQRPAVAKRACPPPAAARDSPPAAMPQGSQPRLWSHAPVPGGTSPVSRDARLLTSERQELERELDDLRRLRDQRGITPSPMKGAFRGDPAALGEEPGEDQMREGVWTLEARIARRQREIDAVILAEQLAASEQADPGELSRILAVREEQRLEHERRLYEEAQEAAERESEQRFAAHRRKLEAMERDHLEAKRHRAEQESKVNVRKSAEAERLAIREELRAKRELLEQKHPDLRTFATAEKAAATKAPAVEVGAVSPQPPRGREDPDDPIITEVPAGAGWRVATTPRTPVPPTPPSDSPQKPASAVGPAAASDSPCERPPLVSPNAVAAEGAAPEAGSSSSQGPRQSSKVFLTRRERIAAGVGARPEPSDGSGPSPYSKHAPPLRKLFRNGRAVSDGVYPIQSTAPRSAET